ncbi:MAG: 50S ribosomal protein L18 [Holophagales bacterium]|nr:50S ribosomal protein L18 [Holophagales bacterium]
MNDSHGKKIKAKHTRRQRTRRRIRGRIQGTAERPRLCVYKSLRYIYAQVIDDSQGTTIAQASSREADLSSGLESSASSVGAAQAVGKLVAERAKDKGVERVVFDRGGFIYHGKIKAVAESARENGLKF